MNRYPHAEHYFGSNQGCKSGQWRGPVADLVKHHLEIATYVAGIRGPFEVFNMIRGSTSFKLSRSLILATIWNALQIVARELYWNLNGCRDTSIRS